MSANEFEGHEALVAELRAGTLDAPGHLHRRVLAGAPTKRRRLAAMSARRRLFLAVPVAASLAVGAAVVNGVFFSSSSRPTPFNAAERVVHDGLATGPKAPAGVVFGPPGSTGAQGPTGAAGATGANGATGVAGAQGYTGSTELHSTAYSATPAAALAPLAGQNAEKALFSRDGLTIPTGRLVHAEANLNVVVPNHDALTRATNEATKIVSGLGGYAQSVQYSASRRGYGRAFLDLRVPLGKTQVAIEKLGQLGRLTGQTVSTQDLEQKFKQQTSQIDQLRRAIRIYQQALQSGTLTGAERIQVQIRLANAQHELKGTQKSRRHTVKSGRTAEIRLNLETKRNAHAIVAPHKTGRLGQMLHNVGTFLALEGIVVLYALIVLVPLILLGLLIWWFTVGRRRREERELLASA